MNKKNKLLYGLIIGSIGLFIIAIIIMLHSKQETKLTKQEQKNLTTVKTIIKNNNKYNIKTTKNKDNTYTYTVYDKNKLKYTITINNKTNKIQVSYTR